MPPLVTAAGSQIGATLGLALPAAWLWPAQMPGAHAWLALLAVGVVCTGVAYILFFRLIENAGPPRALSVTFLVPVFAVLYGVLFLGEHVTAWMVICAVVIVCGTALSTGLLKLGRKPECRDDVGPQDQTQADRAQATQPAGGAGGAAQGRLAPQVRSEPAQERKDGAEEAAVSAVIRANSAQAG
jgi:hypothetical protein